VIKESDKYEIISEGAVHTLVIKKPTTDDEAEYICTAVNVKTSTKLKVEGTLFTLLNSIRILISLILI
jgi:hypothetical protein